MIVGELDELVLRRSIVLAGSVVVGGLTFSEDGFSITPGHEGDLGALRMLRVLNGESVEPFDAGWLG